jgi:hypothetical protein
LRFSCCKSSIPTSFISGLECGNFVDLETGDTIQDRPKKSRGYRARMAEITAGLAREADLRQIHIASSIRAAYLDALEGILDFGEERIPR